MNEDVRVNEKYAHGQLAKAFATAVAHEDAGARRRAEERMRRWDRVVRGMAGGELTIGSRTPVRDLPAWATPVVVRGGFATGEAAAEGPLTQTEAEIAERAGIAPDRRAVFLHMVGEDGLAVLEAMLDSGEYEIEVPEDGALLTVAWLLRVGDRDGALAVLEEIEPLAGRLRFLPAPGSGRDAGTEIVYRETVGDARARIAARPPNRQVAAMNEALTVWNPFFDEMLGLWLETVGPDGRVGIVEPEGWRERGRDLLATYERLAAEHTLCTKHRKPKENPAILRAALDEVVAGREIPRPGLLKTAILAMVARRGVPGGERHTGLRAEQAAQGARPTHHDVARVVVARMAGLPQRDGTPDTGALLVPIGADEADEHGVPEGATVPAAVRRRVEPTLAGSLDTLIERGVVPSAEVMAGLVPQLTGWTTAQEFPDARIRLLMARVYRAFRARRSLLLLNLESQVRLRELPWVAAAQRHRDAGGESRRDAANALRRLGEAALAGFPGTILPNPLISEMGTLARHARLDVPFTEELAADIFMGTFSAKFLAAAQLAGDLLDRSLYARYYGIDYAEVKAMTGRVDRRFRKATARSFGEMCAERAGRGPGYGSPAVNGTVIEQAQIITTHNLAALVHPIGADPAPGWDGLARGAFAAVCRRVAAIQGNPRPLNAAKDAAYAWRQMVFFLALCGTADQIAVTAWLQEEAGRRPEHVRVRLAPALDGLRHVLTGGDLDRGAPVGAERLLGWTTRRHWLVS